MTFLLPKSHLETSASSAAGNLTSFFGHMAPFGGRGKTRILFVQILLGTQGQNVARQQLRRWHMCSRFCETDGVAALQLVTDQFCIKVPRPEGLFSWWEQERRTEGEISNSQFRSLWLDCWWPSPRWPGLCESVKLIHRFTDAAGFCCSSIKYLMASDANSIYALSAR